MTKPTERTYPLPPPDSDSRFTIGLVLDVMDVLTDHGYPAADLSGLDHLAMQQTLFRYLYRGPVDTATGIDTVTGEGC
jgi:hypothetical protein